MIKQEMTSVCIYLRSIFVVQASKFALKLLLVK